VKKFEDMIEPHVVEWGWSKLEVVIPPRIPELQ
jgi:hypothetical protein